MAKGLKTVTPSRGTILNYLQIVYGFFISILILDEDVKILGMFGALLIFLNCIIVFYKN